MINKKSLLSILFFVCCFFAAGAQSYTSKSPSKKVARADEKAVVIINSNVSGASVYINGNYEGKTNLTVSDLMDGTYRVRIEKTGYETEYVKIKAYKGYTSTYYISLKKQTGFINFRGVTSDCLMYISGARKSSKENEVDVGVHSVKVRRFGYYDYTTTVDVKPHHTVIVEPVFTVAPFEMSDYAISKSVINPDYENAFGRTEISFMVTNNGSADVYICDEYDNIVWYNHYYSFNTWNQSCTWKGTNNSGDFVEDGEYKVVITDYGQYSKEFYVSVDRSVLYPLVNYTKSGTGYGTLPASYKINGNFFAPFVYVSPVISSGNEENPGSYYCTALGGGFYADFAGCCELGISGNSYISGNSDLGAAFSVNGNLKLTKTLASLSGNSVCMSALLRYGYSDEKLYAPYGVDWGCGLGIGGILAYDFSSYYAGISSEYVWGASHGIPGEDDAVWRNGIALNYKFSKTFNCGTWTALHSVMGPSPDFMHAVETGVELSGMPGSTALILNLKVKALMFMDANPYLGAEFMLSYLF